MNKRLVILSIISMMLLPVCAQSVHTEKGFNANKMELKSLGKHGVTNVRKRILASTEFALGLCDGDSITTKNVSVGMEGTIPVGAVLYPAQLSSYAGCKIVGMRFALGQAIGATKAFIYSIEKGVINDTIRENNVRRTSVGWNEVRYNSSQEYTIKGNETLLFGFNDIETEDMATSGNGPLAVYKPQTEDQNAFLAYGNFGSGLGFYSLSSLGNLCVQLILDVSSLPEKDIVLGNLINGNKYKKKGEQLDAFLLFSNNGRATINTCTFGYRIDNGETEFVDCTEAVKPGESGSVEKIFNMPASVGVGSHTLEFFVSSIDGVAVDYASDKAIRSPFIVYDKSFARQQHYVEQYSSQRSYFHAYVDDEMFKTDAKDNICLVNIHQSGTSLAAEGTEYLEDLYAYAYPCFTIDRFYFFGESNIAFDVNQYASIMPSLVSESVYMLVDEVDANPAFATVDIAKPTFDNTSRLLTVNVSGDMVEGVGDADIFGDLALTVLLTEDGVVASQTVPNSLGNATTTDRNYVHNAVFRTYMSKPLGDKITQSDNSYNMTFTTTVPEKWNVENMKVVAFIAPYATEVTDDNVLDMDIINANSCRLKGLSTDGIEQTTAEAATADALFYNMQGVCEGKSPRHSGMYIIKVGDKVRKVVIR